jgi:hypothetical protein
VALQAGVVLADQARPGARLLGQRVEHGPEPRIDGRDLGDLAVAAEADVGVVAEVDGPRAARRDAVPLHAGLGEDEHLRRLRHLQLAQEGAEVPEIVLPGQPCRARVEALLQARHGVVGRGRGVVDGRALDVRPAGGGDDGGQQEQPAGAKVTGGGRVDHGRTPAGRRLLDILIQIKYHGREGRQGRITANS